MGLRGPGARPKGGTRIIPGATPPKTPRWEYAGLSRADRVIAFIEALPVTSGAHAGRRFRLRPWQRRIVRAWYATGPGGRRVVRTGLLTMGRKNGKTAMCAALCLAHLLGPEVEPRGHVVAAASDRDQSGLIFNELVAFIRANPVFEARCNIQRHAKLIEDLVSGSTFQALSSDAKKAHGLSPSVIVLDELAQWGTGLGRELYTALTTSTGARKEPLTLVISTQTADDHALMSQLVDYGKRVQAGEIRDPTFSAHIYEVPLDADPWDEAVWPLANPALGDFRSLPEMRIFAARAQQMPTDAAMFRLYYLNQRVQAEARWMALEDWDRCAGPPALAPDPARPAFLGLDLSTTQDLTALVCLLPDDAGGYDVGVDFWCPEVGIAARSERDRVPYALWVEQGYLTPTPGDTVDYGYIEARMLALMDQYRVEVIAVDPWNAQGLLAKWAQANLPVVKVQQSMANLSGANKALQILVGTQRLRHGGHPVLRWCVGNAVADVDGNGNVKLSKHKSTERIDGLAALVTGLSQALLGTGASVYEGRGLLEV